MNVDFKKNDVEYKTTNDESTKHDVYSDKRLLWNISSKGSTHINEHDRCFTEKNGDFYRIRYS